MYIIRNLVSVGKAGLCEFERHRTKQKLSVRKLHVVAVAKKSDQRTATCVSLSRWRDLMSMYGNPVCCGKLGIRDPTNWLKFQSLSLYYNNYNSHSI